MKKEKKNTYNSNPIKKKELKTFGILDNSKTTNS